MSGAVTVDYALEAFQSAGGKAASPFLRALRRGYQEGQVPGRLQTPFKGDWKTVESPHDRMSQGQATTPAAATTPGH